MEFRLGEHADEYRVDVRAFLDEHLPERVRERRLSCSVFHDWDFHRLLGQNGWLGASWPVEYGGEGRDPYEMVAFFEEADRAGAPVDNFKTTLNVAYTILHLGTEEQKDAILRPVLNGEVLISLGYSEPDSGSDVAAAKTRAERDGDSWLINGQKMFTSLARDATHVFLLTRTNTEVPKHKGLTMFLIPIDTEGIEIQPVPTLGGEPTYATFYTDVRVDDAWRVGEVDGGWTVMRAALAYERGVWRRNMVERLYTDAVAWARTPGHDGRRPIEDPINRERLAKLAIDHEISKLLGYRNAWLVATGTPPGVEAAISKLFQTEAFLDHSVEIMDMVGPAGVIRHGEPGAVSEGWMEHSFREAPVKTIAAGSSEIQRELIAEQRLGLPRNRPRD